jgi:hypothetical protein
MIPKKNNFKALILLLVLCFFSFHVKSQIVYSNKETASFAFTVGLTSSNYYNDSISFNAGTLLNGGFAYTLTLSEKTKLGVDLLLTGKAFRKEKPIVKYRYGFVDVPVFLQYNFTEDFKFNIGIQYSKNVFSQFIFLDGSKKNGVNVQSFSSSIDNDFGMLAGLEFNFLKDLNLGVRYTISTKVFSNNTPYFGVFQFAIKYYTWRSNKKYFGKSKE